MQSEQKVFKPFSWTFYLFCPTEDICGITKIPLKVKEKLCFDFVPKVCKENIMWPNVQSTIWWKMRLSNFLHWTKLILIVWFHLFSGLSIGWEDVEQTADFQPSSGFGDSPRIPICGTGLSSGRWHPCALTDVGPPVSNWANNKWKQGAGLQSACLTGARRGCRGSAAFSERSFSTRRPKSTFQLNLQPSECRLNESERKWREMERKWQKEYRGEVWFFFHLKS